MSRSAFSWSLGGLSFLESGLPILPGGGCSTRDQMGTDHTVPRLVKLAGENQAEFHQFHLKIMVFAILLDVRHTFKMAS